VNKAIILAAGKGTRMGELTQELPKPMLSLAGKPMIEHILDRLRDAGVSEALVITGYRAETIESHLRDYPLSLRFLRQQEINGTGTAALLGRDFAERDQFLLTFGDIICEPGDYVGLAGTLENDPAASAVLGVKHVADPFQGAAVYAEGGVVSRVIEKPSKGASTTNWNSAGLYAFRPEIFEYLSALRPSPRGEYELTTAVSDMLTARRRVLLYAIRGEWRDVGRPEDLGAAEELVD
jgi:UDP-N-acetylglucosamine diphosphorylase / glucose-1-phosphate thymidylyltransferase / UDP-N-acetylgalactosamine diphosphorylase / glucosamine-1-phosphate N-acetyltransferase / galactosamine-1-phosphate N-acetyltransferase